jgi:hypothetical protein
MDSTVMRYDQQHKVGARTKKKLLGRGGFTYLHKRDNKAAEAHNVQTNDARRNLMGKVQLKQNFYMTHCMVLLLCCTHNCEESRGKYLVKVKKVTSIKTVGVTTSDSATFNQLRQLIAL